MKQQVVSGDRNFDDLAERFEKRIYGSNKGKIRQAIIWQDLKSSLTESKKLRVLDLGGGLGHFSIKLSLLGHDVCFTDISQAMTQKAIEFASQAGVDGKINWNVLSYQQFAEQHQGRFDLILCHARLSRRYVWICYC